MKMLNSSWTVTMNLIQILTILSIGAVTSLHEDYVTNIAITNENVILAKIITNYLTKYFRDDPIFVSIVLEPSNEARKYSIGDLFISLFACSTTFTEFTYNILSELSNISRGRKHAFNLILIDESKSLK